MTKIEQWYKDYRTDKGLTDSENVSQWELLLWLSNKPDISLSTYKINRVEVIDEKGRAYVNWKKENSVYLSLQDDDRTLKIFISQK